MFHFQKIHFLILSLAITLSMGCASPQFMAQPSDHVIVMPDGKMASSSKEGLAVNVTKTSTPYGLSSKITTFRVTLINQTDRPIEFIPKEYLLFDQNNRQHPALTKPDLSEAAGRGGGPHGSVAWGFGAGTFRSHSMFSMHYYSHPFFGYDPYFPRRTYQGLLANALPIHPFTVFPHAMVDGNIYFAVSPKSLRTARIQITRLSKIPEKDSPAQQIPYIIVFDVVK